MDNLPRQGAFQRDPQAGFTLPADLDRGGRAAIEGDAAVQPLEPVGGQLAGDFDDDFVLHAGGVSGQFAYDAPVLRVDDEAAGVRLQWCAQSQLGEMFLQRPDTGGVLGPQGGGREQVRRGWVACRRVMAGRLVQQQRDGFGLREIGTGIDLDTLLGDAELRFLDHHAVHPHPAARDV